MTKTQRDEYWKKTLANMPDEQFAQLYTYFAGLPFNEAVSEILSYFAAEFINRPTLLHTLAEGK